MSEVNVGREWSVSVPVNQNAKMVRFRVPITCDPFLVIHELPIHLTRSGLKALRTH